MQPILAVRPSAASSTPNATRSSPANAAGAPPRSPGSPSVPCLVRDDSRRGRAGHVAHREHPARRPQPLEEAAGIQRLIEEFGMTHQQAADAVGRSRPAASNLLRLLQLAAGAGAADGRRHRHGPRPGAAALDGAAQIGLANLIAARGLSVREAERLVQALNPKTKPPAPAPDRDILRLEEEIADRLGATVKIKANKKGVGAVTIQFGNLDQPTACSKSCASHLGPAPGGLSGLHSDSPETAPASRCGWRLSAARFSA